jgi:hypothetical protein
MAIRGPKVASAVFGHNATGWRDFFRTAGSGIKKNAFTSQGIDRLVGNAVTGVMWGGGIGGTLEMAQGGSFWEGAKTGAFRGAALGAGGTMINNAARGFSSNVSGFRGTKDVMSKQLKAVLRHKANMNNAGL